MPVILPQPTIDHWLDPAVSDPDELKPMLKQFPSEEMPKWSVGKAMENVRNQGAALIEPIDAATDLKCE
jgi:putative SOS response-associated peptidase YedK